jgi:argininosuccinate synthase
VEVASREGADAIAHGCTGKGNDQVRFDVATHALDPGLEVIAPMRVGMGLSRDQEIDYAQERNIEIPITKASPYSIDVNIWGVTFSHDPQRFRPLHVDVDRLCLPHELRIHTITT